MHDAKNKGRESTLNQTMERVRGGGGGERGKVKDCENLSSLTFFSFVSFFLEHFVRCLFLVWIFFLAGGKVVCVVVLGTWSRVSSCCSVL